MILDCGCGDGYWSLFFSQFLGCKVTGVDYNPLRIKRARSIVKNCRFIEADLTKKINTFGKFDIVFCNQVIEHIKDDISFLENIKKNLKKNGIFILGTPNEGSFLHNNIFRKKILERSDHVQFYREKIIKLKLKKTGFIIKDIYREVFFPGLDKLYYQMTSNDFGFKLLELLTILFPSQCSDFYFKCVLSDNHE